MSGRAIAGLALLLGGVLVFGSAFYQQAVGSDGTLLVPEDGSRWIKRRSWTAPRARVEAPTHHFRLRVFLAVAPEKAPASIETLGRQQVRVNGELVPGEDARDPALRHLRELDLAPWLARGPNEIVVRVERETGPPLLRLHAAGLSTGERAWEVSVRGALWEPASLASEKLPIAQAALHPFGERIAGALPWMGVLFGLGGLGALLAGRLPAFRRILEPSTLRWLGFAAWGVLAANNVMRLPLSVGFDAPHHYDYVQFLVQHGIPYADDGWQMFQPPLAYLLAVPLFVALSALAGPDPAHLLLRLLPLACGMAQVEIGYRAGRAVFPGRPDLQRLAILVGGFLPMNVYIAQALGNEPVSGLLTAALVLVCLKLLSGSSLAISRIAPLLGLLLGLALLTKVSAVVLLPALVLGLLWIAERRGISRAGAAGLVAGTLAVAGVVAGWYYVRNWLHLGRPFVGGWDPARGIVWWQDPGYRIPADFYSFGAALTKPLYAAVYSVWDGLYSTLWLDGYLSGSVSPIPPWNYDFLISMSVLSAPMTLALLAGGVRGLLALREPALRPLGFCTACAACFVAAFLWLYLEVPSYASAKATYALGITPCLALLCAAGLDPVLRLRAGRVLVGGYVCCWLGINYATYFVC